MPRDHRLYLDDILEAIGNIREYLKTRGEWGTRLERAQHFLGYRTKSKDRLTERKF